MAKVEVEHEPITIALVRDIHQRGYYSQIVNPQIREDGWLYDPTLTAWYSPDNVISVSTFTPRKWDGNAIPPGTLCNFKLWKGVTSECPTGFEDVKVVILNRHAGKRSYNVIMPDGKRKLLGERRIAPVPGGQDAT